jgi:hypothetical protein
MFSGNSTEVEPNGFNSRAIAETDRAYIHLPDTGMDPFDRLFSSETMIIIAQPWWAVGV